MDARLWHALSHSAVRRNVTDAAVVAATITPSDSAAAEPGNEKK